MDNYAVVKFSGFDYFVRLGEKLLVNRLNYEVGKEIDLKPVLLSNLNGQIQIGTPEINLLVKARVIKHLRGKKIEVRKFKSKVRYRKHIGFRPDLTELKIIQIGNLKLDEAISSENKNVSEKTIENIEMSSKKSTPSKKTSRKKKETQNKVSKSKKSSKNNTAKRLSKTQE